MSLILIQETASSIPAPIAGKGTLFLNDTNQLVIKDSGNATITVPTLSSSTNTQVVFNDVGAFGQSANFVFDKTSNTLTLTNLSVTGTLSAGDISVSSISNGTSNVDIVGVGGNVTISVGGVANVLTVTSTGANISGTLSVSGNANIGNIGTALITATGNITGANLVTSGVLSVTGNANIGNIGTAFISATGNITSATLTANGTVGNGIIGGASTSGTTKGTGVTGQAYVTASADTGAAVGVRGYAVDTHLGGYNIGVLGNALGSGTGNYAFYLQNGGIASIENTAAWDLYDNSSTALVWQSTGKANILGLDTTDGAEGVYTSGYLSATGNVTGGNLKTSGLVSATGNVTGGNITTAGILVSSVATGTAPFTVTSTTQVANLSVATAGSATTAGTVTTNAQPNITSTGTLASLSVTANANIGNIGTGGLITATGNITGANITVGGLITATGNVTGSNLIASSTTATTSKTTGALIVSGGAGVAGDIWVGNSFTVNNGSYGEVVTTQFASVFGTGSGPNPRSIFQARAADLTAGIGMQAYSGINGQLYSNTGITFTTGATIRDKDYPTGGTTSATLDSSGLSVTGIVSASGNVTGANLVTGGIVSATGNGTFGNVTATLHVGNISGTGNSNVGNLGTTQLVATGAGSFGGNVNLNSFNINNLATPSANADAATKAYVDGLVSTGLYYHAAVNVATTTTLATTTGGTITYNNGTAGVNANLVTTGSFNLIDTANVQTVGARILVKNEANATWNGIYTWANASTIVRATDADTYGPGAGDLSENDYFFVSQGNVNIGTAYVCNTAGTIVFGTTNINFSLFSTSQVYANGTGLGLSGTTFSVNASQTQVTAVGTLTTLSVSGNANIGNIGTGGLITATGNITGGNFTTAGQLVSTVATGTAPLVVSSTTTVANLTAAVATVAGTVTTAAQGNITSVGILTALSVSGNITAGNISATNHTGTTANITGQYISTLATGTAPLVVSSTTQVANLNAATAGTAGTVTTAAQPNITSVSTSFTSLTFANAQTITGNNMTFSTGANTNAGTITGNWTLSVGSKWNATYADLSEKYVADAEYDPGTVLLFGGEKEVTLSDALNSTRVAGVVTTDAAYTMNSGLEAEFVADVALQGRVPVKVIGPIYKGDLLVSAGNGHAIANNDARAGTIIGKSLENFNSASGVIEVAVGRF